MIQGGMKILSRLIRGRSWAIARRTDTLAQRLMRRVSCITPSQRFRQLGGWIGGAEWVGKGCWWWMGAKDTNGYGSVSWQGIQMLAHRVSYALAKGPIPTGLVIDHLCRNKACINPEHLEAVSQKTNCMRARQARQEAA